VEEGSDNVTTVSEEPADLALGRRKRGVELEDAILDAAFEELSEVGYTAFTVEGVAARARTGKASIYRRWPTKAELACEAMIRFLPTPSQCGIAPCVPDNVTTVDALRGVARAIARVLKSPAGDVIRAVKCEAAADPSLARLIDDKFQAPRRAALLGLLRRGVERGEVRPEAVTPLVADVLPALLTHRMILMREPVGERTISDIVEQVLIPLIAAR
jgi:AcrR family transcriptional regulator